MDQNSNASNLLFNSRTIEAVEELVNDNRLPDGHATLLYLKMVNAVYAPIDDPNYGSPFDCHVSLWTGLYCFRYWRAFIKLESNSLTLGDNFCSLEFYNTVEGTVHGCTNWLLVLKRHKPPHIEWRLAAPCRNVSTTTDMEGTYAEIRLGKIGHHNSVNCTLKVSGDSHNFERQYGTGSCGHFMSPTRHISARYLSIRFPRSLVLAAQKPEWRSAAFEFRSRGTKRRHGKSNRRLKLKCGFSLRRLLTI